MESTFAGAADPDRAPIDTKSVSKEETEVSVVLTARLVRHAVVDARWGTSLHLRKPIKFCINASDIRCCSVEWLSHYQPRFFKPCLPWPSLCMTSTHHGMTGHQRRCRNEGKSAQEVSQQLKSPSSSWLSRTATLLDRVINHDASLASWQELYRLVSALDFGAGMPIGLATVRQVTSQLGPTHSAEASAACFGTGLLGTCKMR